MSLLILLLAAQSPPRECAVEMREHWPALVKTANEGVPVELTILDIVERAPSRHATPPSKQAALETIASLNERCSTSTQSLQDLRALEAELRLSIGDAAGALAALDRGSVPESGRTATLDHLNRLRAASATRDADRFQREASKVRDAHRELAVQQGLQTVGFETDLASVDGFIRGDDAIFTAWPKGKAGMPVTLYVRGGRDISLVGCDISTRLDSDESPTPEMKARRIFSDSEMLDEMSADFHFPCLSLEKVLPAFAMPYRFTGEEYAPADVAPSAQALDAMLGGSGEQRKRVVDYVVMNPQAVSPFGLLPVVQDLLDRGDSLRAAFLFYFWQIRSEPWAELGSPDGEGALRGAVNATLGQAINEWIGSDPEAMQALIRLAIAFEARTPPSPGRPAGVSAAKWSSTVAKARRAYSVGHETAFAETDRQQWLEERRRNGLYVGPLVAPGAPLPDNWR